MKKRKKGKFSKLEKFLYNTGIFICVVLVVATVFTQTALAKLNLEVQKLQQEVEEQEDINTSIQMKINELASLENIQNVSNSEGLSYISENIKTIE